MLHTVAKLIVDGYTSGYDPYWNLKCDDYDKLGDTDLMTLADLVLQGYTNGILPVIVDFENETEENIYWSIDYNEDEMENDDDLTIEDII